MIIGLVTVCVILFFKFDMRVFVTLLFTYLPEILSLIVALKLAIATGKGTSLSDELKINGHIANIIKLLVVLMILAAGIYFFTISFKDVVRANKKMLLYYGFMMTIFIWSLASLFNFYAYILIAKANKKATPAELYNFW